MTLGLCSFHVQEGCKEAVLTHLKVKHPFLTISNVGGGSQTGLLKKKKNRKALACRKQLRALMPRIETSYFMEVRIFHILFRGDNARAQSAKCLLKALGLAVVQETFPCAVFAAVVRLIRS